MHAMQRGDRSDLSRAYARIASECVCSNLRQATRSVTQAFDEVLRPSGLRATQLPVLVALSLAGALPMSGLGKALKMDRTTLTRNLRPMLGAGLVRIASGATDRRQRVVELTPTGARALEEAVPLWREAQAKVLKRLGGPQWAKLLPELRALSRAPQSK